MKELTKEKCDYCKKPFEDGSTVTLREYHPDCDPVSGLLNQENKCEHKNKDPQHPKCLHCLDCGYDKCADTPIPDEGWVEQYYKLWIKNPSKQADIKSFIQDLLTDRIKRLEDMRKEVCCPEITNQDDYCCMKVRGYNDCLNQAIKLLKQ